MTELLGIISAVLGIAGAIWSFIKFILRPRQELSNVKQIMEARFVEWQKYPWISGGRTLIPYEDFRLIKKYKRRLKHLDDERLAFLLRNAIQHGKTVGEWGYWLARNKNNDKHVFALLSAIGAPDWQPRWRAAYILEVACDKDTERIVEILPDLSKEPKAQERIQATLGVISTTGVEQYLATSQDNEQKQKKSERVLEEIEIFGDYVEEYRRAQRQRPLNNVVA